VRRHAQGGRDLLAAQVLPIRELERDAEVERQRVEGLRHELAILRAREQAAALRAQIRDRSRSEIVDGSPQPLPQMIEQAVARDREQVAAKRRAFDAAAALHAVEKRALDQILDVVAELAAEEPTHRVEVPLDERVSCRPVSRAPGIEQLLVGRHAESFIRVVAVVYPSMVVDELVRQARPEQRDAVAAVLRAKVRRALVGADVPQPTIGRFTVLERVGAGGVGTVYAAYDPVLDRRIAIKVLAGSSADNRDDLLAEARALAKLRHPNVVAVHEAGHVGDELYIAMEFVEGQTLRAWLDAGDRSAREIEDVLVAAGRGLAAAHASGIAHGDFKPHNVLVGGDGVRVADFGMAHLTGSDASGQRSHGGTPAYMAPERLDGGAPSPAADQFAFAVTVFEAAVGRRPFEGSSIGALREAMRQPLAVPRVVSPRARWLSVARRGLAPSPTDRFASMDAMLVQLQPRRSTLARTAVLGIAISIVTAATIVASTRADADPCGGGAIAMSTTWDDTRAATVREAIVGASPIFGEAVAERVEHRLDDYRDGWIEVHRRVCEATRVQATQSDSLHDVRMRCLERRRVSLDEVAVVLGEVEHAREVADALEAAEGLRPVLDCETADADDSELALPSDPADREAVDRVRRDLDRAWALFRMERYPDAARIADAALGTAEAIAFEPLLAECLLLAGTVRGRIDDLAAAEPILRNARVMAARVGNDRLASEVSMQLLRSLMFAHDEERVEDLADFARADAIRAGADPNEVDGIVGEAWLHAGDPSRAFAAIETALATERRPSRIAVLQTNAGSARLAAGDVTEALAWYRRALDTATEHFGAEHPAVGFHLQRFGRGQLAAGQTDEALRTLTEALRSREAALGPDDRAVASSLTDLARAEAAVGRHHDARNHLRRALAIRTAEFGAEDPTLAVVLLQLGDVDLASGAAASALEHYAGARSLRESADPIHPELVQALRGEAAALEALGRTEHAAASRARSESLAARLPAGHRLQSSETSSISAVKTLPPG
jgi:tetratricopeptide (TPR) repeat protein/predicted Ser/Thr protein kinase